MKRTRIEYDNVLALWKEQKSKRAISRLTGISMKTVCNWINGKTKRIPKTIADEENFIRFVKESFSISEVIKKCGLVTAGGNYKTIKLRIEKLGLDNSHFLGQGHLKGKKNIWKKSKPLEEILVKDSTYTSTNDLRKRLLKEGVFEHKCYNCELVTWNGKPTPLELEHKNGDSRDHRIENLTLLCPNCHAQTPTYRGKNIKKKTREQKKIEQKNRPKYFCQCGKEIKKDSKQCYTCSYKSQQKVERPSKEELLKLVSKHGYSKTGRMFGVSDNAIRKWIKSPLTK